MARIDPPVQSYMTRVLKRLGVPVTPQNVSFMAGWAQREGVPQNIDRYNYLGTTLPMDGSYGTNAPGVQSYPSEDAGIRAHASMLGQSNFTALRRMLAGGDPYKLREDPRVQAAFRLWSGGGYSWPLHGDQPDLGAALTSYPTGADLPFQGGSTQGEPAAPALAQEGSETAPSGGISQARLALLTDRLSRSGGFGSRYPAVAAQLLSRRLGGSEPEVRATPPEEAAAAPSDAAPSGELGGATYSPMGSELVAVHGSQTPQRIVLHTTESEGQPEDITAFWQNQGKGYGAQFIIGSDGRVLQAAPPTALTYHAGGANQGSVGIEIMGAAKYSRDEWLRRPKQLDSIARTLARLSREYGIPLEFGSGITTHAEISKTNASSEGHWDPGPGFPLDFVISRARGYLR